jgi:hypothetical protein
VSTVDIFGWIAGALVLATFCLRTMIPLRGVAIASNIAFVAYGLMANTLPIVVLHLALLPMNLLRLHEMRSLIGRVKRASRGNLCLDMLVPYMQLRQVPAGTTLFNKGDHAEDVYLVLEGSIRIAGKNTLVKTGRLVGEMGIFAPGQRQTDTAVCESDVCLASITNDRIWELVYGTPEFGAYLLRLIMLRYHEEQEDCPGRVPQ